MTNNRTAFARECDRRRRANLTLTGNTYAIRDEIKAAGGIWDGRGRQWLLPDRETLARFEARLSPSSDRPANRAAVEVEGLADFAEFLIAARAHKTWPKVVLRTGADRKVVAKIAGDRSRFPGSINLTDGRTYGEGTWFGRIVDGVWQAPNRLDAEIAADVADLLVRVATDHVAAIAAHGHESGECALCGQELTRGESCRRGYGPTCAENHGLPFNHAAYRAEAETAAA